MPDYKNKRKLDDGTVVYEYSDQQIKKRDQEKAERLQKLDKSIGDLRKKVTEDIGSDDAVKSMTALAIALMDETYSRVGNLDSAKEGHFGTTTWRKKHITFSDGKAKIKYVGKSGVKQEKVVKDSKVVGVLKELVKDLSSEDPIFECEGDDDNEICVRPEDVNKYLKEFDITAKDIRGYHANQRMREALDEVRKGKLPEDKKEKEEQLKDEFKKALEIVAEDVGHEAATLKSNYLVPGMEESYLKDGTVIKKLDKKAMASRVAAAYMDKLAGRLEEGLIAAIPGKWVLSSEFSRGTLRYYIDPKGGQYREIDRGYAEELYHKATRRFIAFDDAFERW